MSEERPGQRSEDPPPESGVSRAGEARGNSTATDGEPRQVEPAPGPRRLRRSRDERVIGGVAGGLGDYLSVDPVFVRIAFVLLTILSGGIGILFYIVGWMVMPVGRPGATPHPQSQSEHEGRPAVAIALGALLVIVGVVWLLRALDIPTPGLDVVLAAALLFTGVVLVIGARRGRQGGLISLGVVLTVALTAIAAVDIGVDFEGGFGDRTERPSTIAELEDGYSHIFGSLTVDLRGVEFPEGRTDLDISTVFGSVVVRLPEDLGVRVEASAVFGSAEVFGSEISGVADERTFTTPGYSSASRRLSIDLSTVFGSAEVRR